MCRASSEAGGPKRCSGGIPGIAIRAAAAVAELERSETALDEGMRRSAANWIPRWRLRQSDMSDLAGVPRPRRDPRR